MVEIKITVQFFRPKSEQKLWFYVYTESKFLTNAKKLPQHP